jgi:folylpolyglutamate synthase
MHVLTWFHQLSNGTRWDCIQIDNEPVDEALFRKVEKHYLDLGLREGINASPFEILTATAFHIFNEEKVKVGVVEVGMGGKLDATNILQNQAVSVISKIARDHQNFLGNTLEEITMHKAGILRPRVPFVVNRTNEGFVQSIIDEYAQEIGAGPRINPESPELHQGIFRKQDWKMFVDPLRPFQRDNAMLAVVAVREAAQSVNRGMRDPILARTIWECRHRQNPGRTETVKVQPVFSDPRAASSKGRTILIDGAHNVDAARMLKQHVDTNERRRHIHKAKVTEREKRKMQSRAVTWVLAMTDGKDARGYLEVLLEPGDTVITTTFGPVDGMPWVKPMDPEELLAIAKSAQPDITGLAIPEDGVLRALCTARYLAEEDYPIVMTGSLYLVGELYRELRTNNRAGKTWKKEPEYEDDRKYFETMQKEEQRRVNQFLSVSEDPFGRRYEAYAVQDEEKEAQRNADRIERERRRSIQADIAALDREMELLAEDEKRLSQEEPHKSIEASQPPQEDDSLETNGDIFPKTNEDVSPKTNEDVSPKTNKSQQQQPSDTLSVDPFAEITYAKYKDSVPVFPEGPKIIKKKVGYSRLRFRKHVVGEHSLVRRMRWGH